MVMTVLSTPSPNDQAGLLMSTSWGTLKRLRRLWLWHLKEAVEP